MDFAHTTALDFRSSLSAVTTLPTHEMFSEFYEDEDEIVPPKLSWFGLPYEIRHLILEAIARRVDCGFTTGFNGLAPLAMVCMEWKSFVEKRTFRRLTLAPSDLAMFRKVAVEGWPNSRFRYVRHIWLRIKLSRYSCSDCLDAEDDNTVARYSVMFPPLWNESKADHCGPQE